MAEEITYIPYGLNEISQLDLMTNLANGLPSFMQQYKWLLKPKNQEKFLKAYDDITKNLTGATDSSGRWIINVNNIDIDGMSPKDKEIYEHAAYYIQLQMSLMTPRVKKEEKKNENLDKFDFIKSFNQLLLNNYYGGNLTLFADSEQGWNALDARGSDGLRGTDKRRERMIEALESYKKGLEGKNFNFEGTSFNDINDANNKILAAIDALKTSGEEDDLKAFSALGLPYRSYFSNGGNDASGYLDSNGNSLTWQQYNEYKNRLNETKAKAEAEATKLKLAQLATNQYKRFRFHKGTGVSAEYLSKYGNNVLGQLSGYGTNGLQLTQELKNELVGAFQIAAKNGQLENLSKEELSKFGKGYTNNPQRLKKIKGLEGFYWDTIGNRVIQPFMETTTPLTFLDIINANSPQVKLQLYLNNTEFTDADWAELGGIVGDIVSIVDPEPISAGIAGVAAAGARNYARTRGPEKWGVMDYLSQGMDYLTGGIGAIPGFGDAVLAAKVTKNVVPWLRRAMRIPAFLDLWNSTPELIPIGNKLMNGENLTVQDWMNLGTFFRGLATTRNLNVTNRASRKALLERGYQVSNRIDKRLGLTSSKPVGESIQPTIKMNIKGKEESIPITKELKDELELELSKKGNDIEARNKVIRENTKVQEAAEKAGFKVKEEVTDASGNVTQKISDDWNNSSIVYNNSILNSLRNARLFGSRMGLTPSWARTSGGTFGLQSNSINRNFDNFNNYINSERGLWDKFKYGSNRTLRGMDRFNSALYGIYGANNIEGIQYLGELENKDLLILQNAFNPPIRKLHGLTRVINPKNYKSDIDLIDGTKAEVEFGKNTSTGREEIFFIVNGLRNQVPGNSLHEMKLNLGKMIKDINLKILTNNRTINNVNDLKWKNFVKSIKDLKRKGYLYKYGGQINSLDKIIEDFINNNNI